MEATEDQGCFRVNRCSISINSLPHVAKRMCVISRNAETTTALPFQDLESFQDGCWAAALLGFGRYRTSEPLCCDLKGSPLDSNELDLGRVPY